MLIHGGYNGNDALDDMFVFSLGKINKLIYISNSRISIQSRDLARIFLTGCPNWDFKNLGCPQSLIEKVKIIALFKKKKTYQNLWCHFT